MWITRPETPRFCVGHSVRLVMDKSVQALRVRSNWYTEP